MKVKFLNCAAPSPHNTNTGQAGGMLNTQGAMSSHGYDKQKNCLFTVWTHYIKNPIVGIIHMMPFTFK